MAAGEQQVNAAFAQVLAQIDAQQVDPGVGNAVIAAMNADAGTPELRVWVDTANAFGHHATTTNLLKRMVQLGLTKPIRVFCTLADGPKLELFLPGYARGDPQVVYQGVTINFTYDAAVPAAASSLLISGGSEADTDELSERLATTNCAFYLQLQPWHWKSADYVFFGPQQPTPQFRELAGQPTLGGPRYSYYAYTEAAPARDDALWDLYGGLARFTARVAMAKRIATKAPDVYVQPAYGLGTKSDPFMTLLTFVLGALKIQDVMAARGMPVKPVVLLVFDAVEPEKWAELQGWADGTSEDEEYPEELRELVQHEHLATRLRYRYDDDAAALGQQLAALAGDQVLVVGMSSCPDEIFRYFYGAATLPCVFEGRGTQNLVLNTGQPFLCVNPLGYPSLAFSEATPPEADPAIAAMGQLKRGSPFAYGKADTSTFPSEMYGTNVVALLQDQQARGYFTSLGEVYGDPSVDKLRTSLRYLRSLAGWNL